MQSFTIIIHVLTLSLLYHFYVILAQQPYIGVATNACSQTLNSNSILGYTCNGLKPSCQSYLTFKSQINYNSVPTISSLLNIDPTQLSKANSVSQNATFEINKLVIVPVNCSCFANQYYQYNTSYKVQSGDNYFIIANNTFEGLSTCQAMKDQNKIDELKLSPGDKLRVPLRCACPTKNQTEKGFKYLLSYLVSFGDDVSQISERFGVTIETILEANSLSSQKPTINPFTTLLVPLQEKPSSSQTVLTPPPPSLSPSPLPPPPSSGGSSSKTWVYVVVGVVGGVVLVLVLVLFSIIFRNHFHKIRKKKKKKDNSVIVSKSFEAIEKQLEEDSETLSEIISDIAQSFKVYRFKELQSATNDFSSEFLIKGSVYRGLINRDLAAIKKINRDVSKEVQLLNKVNHSNVIRLSGVSFNEGHWYLVYEYAANGPLSDCIFMENGQFLSWKQRIKIALDVATGLDYLHSFTSPPFIHKDLKCDNILLDADFRAKIANFGLARSIQGEEDEFSMTRHIVGTRNYMAPEYLQNGIVSTKLDVYAFGVMVVEILSGREVAAIYEEYDKKNLEEILSSIVKEEGDHEKLKEFMDPSLKGNYATEHAVFIIGMIEKCIKKDLASRPSMQDIVSSLSKALDSLNWESSVNISG
ncbi:lysM domain receptor-like kinase 4 [Arachis stenosperma]|uniref:lysM domain receptor-like kinase 4 n=1 Tax=Arachis stenosperma TaxID=217475 RepID=UPI0025ABB269|nr:lysM domain receptor-like kinase 4 [Arachis stenosperma]